MHHRPVLSLLLAIGCAASAASGQLGPDQDWVQLDRVVATINDAVILQSEVLTDAAGRMRVTRARLGRELAPAERQYLFGLALGDRIDRHALAQAAKTLGILPPDRVEELFQQELRDEEQDQVRDLGSVQRYTEEMARLGWETYERQQRVQKLSRMAEQMSVSTRLQNQENLFVTPRMMREFYRVNQHLFVHDATAEVGMVAFTGPGARDVAVEAAAAWAAEELSPDALARQFAARGSRLPQVEIVEQSRREALAPEIFDFGSRGPAGRVSEPVQRGAAFWIYKVLSYTPARSSQFAEPEVQAEISRRMRDRVYEALLQQTKRRAHDRTYVWMAPDMR